LGDISDYIFSFGFFFTAFFTAFFFTTFLAAFFLVAAFFVVVGRGPPGASVLGEQGGFCARGCGGCRKKE